MFDLIQRPHTFTHMQVYPPGYGNLTGKRHLGLDILAPVGTPIRAHCSGRVESLYGNQGGNTAHFHTRGALYRYLHLQHRPEAQEVKRGDIIGYTGNTGLSTTPHLHIDISVNGKLELNNLSNFADPLMYFHTPIKVKLIGQTSNNWNEAVDFLSAHGIQLDVEYVHTPVTLPFVFNERVELWRTAYTYGHHMNDCDIVCFVPDNWEGMYRGFYDTTIVKAIGKPFGLHQIFVKKTTDPRTISSFPFTDPMLSTFCHEIFHALYAMAGMQDRVHELDYEKKTIMTEHGIDLRTVRTRTKEIETRDFYRVFKKKEGYVEERRVPKALARLFNDGINYWSVFGFSTRL